MNNDEMNIPQEIDENNSDMTLPMNNVENNMSDSYEEEPIEQDINHPNNEVNNEVNNTPEKPKMNMYYIIILVIVLLALGLLVWKFMPQIKGLLNKNKGTASTSTSGKLVSSA